MTISSALTSVSSAFSSAVSAVASKLPTLTHKQKQVAAIAVAIFAAFAAVWGAYRHFTKTATAVKEKNPPVNPPVEEKKAGTPSATAATNLNDNKEQP